MSLSTLFLEQMLLIRRTEEAIARHYPEQKMRCPVHLSIGQEAAAVGVCAALEATDLAVSTHRAHAHYLAKGGDLDALIAELHGKSTGCCGGRGGSMHLSDTKVGFVASTAIVGNSIPVGVGLALSLKQKRSDRISCIFLGDGATEEGAFYESANFAVVRNLPVLFACENNFYSVYSSLDKRQPKNRSLAELAKAIGLNTVVVDGNDVEAVHTATNAAISAIRNGLGPYFIEMPTYRWLEHCGPYDDDHLNYRPHGELAYWKSRDPIQQLIERLQLCAEDLNTMETKIAHRIDVAFAKADTAPFPDPSSGMDGIYATVLGPQL
ncbi:thiamine pyrophosphate-dependent dehydrogenase E1 component subunit alpha [Aquitalea magnusonii]|uniref:Pyruvate dehydrogenase E1 component alpha subunit n=1 Tax=Aquitalea magnusonii TaxID=332411 RepID=A0A318J8D7_9NEIS|nr:thiamine pyrophosphate-dependent dehydrogenase E1 component subunit alpha [Aquitalea magnusonii]PXX44367.1 pyruvate dehydrogenase E1 component alpha subunit [Aquitalea magnusonii]